MFQRRRGQGPCSQRAPRAGGEGKGILSQDREKKDEVGEKKKKSALSLLDVASAGCHRRKPGARVPSGHNSAGHQASAGQGWIRASGDHLRSPPCPGCLPPRGTSHPRSRAVPAPRLLRKGYGPNLTRRTCAGSAASSAFKGCLSRHWIETSSPPGNPALGPRSDIKFPE